MTDQLTTPDNLALAVHELADIRAQETRADAKAFQALGAASGLLLGAAAVIGAMKPSGPAIVAWALTLGVLVAGGSFAGAAFLPRLGGDHGIVRWARLRPEQIQQQLRAWAGDPELLEEARAVQMHHLSTAVTRRYRAGRRALLVLFAAVPLAAVAVLLTAVTKGEA